jgi:CubicO group peptidase (beta-lactamase class C family)
MMIRSRRFVLVMLVVALLFLSGVPATVRAETRNASLDAAELEAFFDGVVLSNMDTRHIPGAVVVVVQDGEVRFSKGYGYADVAAGTPVDPATTIFRIGSVSKLFTWTAVMQLVDQGQIDLDADINEYLDFEIPATYPEPITMAHLMSHTAGFEDRSFAVYAESVEMLNSNREWLPTHIPARVRPPGTIAAYSNYGTALAGYIVERVSGVAYADYIDQAIFQPLAMEHSTALQPLPETLAADMAGGYRFVNGTYAAQPFELLNIAPAGALSATGLDMANFMIAHLQDGRFGTGQILAPETARLMYSRHFAHDERLNGMAHGFWEQQHGEQRVIGHGGDTLLFHSGFKLLLDANTGIFVSCNSAECVGFPGVVSGAFLDRFYPVAQPTLTPTETADEHAALVAGQYRSTRMSYTTAERVLGLLGTVTITPVESDAITFAGNRFIETEPLLFREVGGDGVLAFRQDAAGTVTHVFINQAPPFVFERVSGMDLPGPNYSLLGAVLILFLSVLIGTPLLALARRGCPQTVQSPAERAARWLLVLMVGLGMAFLVLFGITVFDEGTPLYDGSPLILVWNALFFAMAGLALAAFVATILAWSRRYWSMVGRVHFTLVTLAAWGLIWFVGHWHLLSL